MIYYISTKDLMKKYSKLPKKAIDDTNFIVLSNRVRITKERQNVLSATHMLINGGQLKGVGMDIHTDSPLARDQFKYFLLKNPKSLSLLVSMIECDIAAGENSVLICSPEELKVGYMEVICDVINELFHYRINQYPEKSEFDPEDTIKRVLYYKKEIKKRKFDMMSDGEKLRYVQKLSKKKLKKALIKQGEDVDGLSRVDMEDIFLQNMALRSGVKED